MYGNLNWQAGFYEGTKCKICGATISSDASNKKRHLTGRHATHAEVKKHMVEASLLKTRKGQPAETQTQKKITDFNSTPTDVSETVAMMFATSFVPFALAENFHLQRIINLASAASGSRYTAPNRKKIASEVSAKSMERLQQALERLSNANVTLAFDSGTVWRRYLVCTAVCPGSPALILHAKCTEPPSHLPWNRRTRAQAN